MVRIAHFSDVHISSPSATLWRLWQGKRLLGGMNMLLFRQRELQNIRFPVLLEHLETQGVDHLIVSGDLTTTALKAEFAHAQMALQPWLDAQKVTTIPGNHDIYTPREAKKRRYESFFGQTHGESTSITGYPFVKQLPSHDIVLIGCNSCVPTGLSGAWGVLGEQQLQDIEAALREHKDRYRILIMHHFLQDRHGRAGLPRRGLRDRDALMAILQREGCELILHGHEHARYTYNVPGPQAPIPVYNPGPSNCISKLRHHPGGYLIYELQDHQLDHVKGFSLSFPDGQIITDPDAPQPQAA